jgi:hypothetical protein
MRVESADNLNIFRVAATESLAAATHFRIENYVLMDDQVATSK